MSIDYFGHTTRDAKDATALLAQARAAHPEWFDVILLLYDARPPGRFDAEIAREFGVEGLKSRFMLSVNDKERFSDCLADALEYIYEIFGTDGLVITWGLDKIHPPLRPHAGRELDR